MNKQTMAMMMKMHSGVPERSTIISKPRCRCIQTPGSGSDGGQLLEDTALAADRHDLANIDRAIFRINGPIRDFAGSLISAFRGVYFDRFERFEQTEPVLPIRFFNPIEPPEFLPQFIMIFLHQRL